MRIVAGRWRGRALQAPPGATTRPTADRLRQALFDSLWHAPWAGRGVIEGAAVLDAFAGTGALGLEALSRGAARAFFIEQDRAALAALRANVVALRAEGMARVIGGSALRPPPADTPCGLVFLDPPYGKDLGPAALAALRAAGWIAPGALACLETGRDEERPELPGWEVVAEREGGAARMLVLRGT
ncbi:16S rRNA (guanine(966)-N(2))-methyltransferase RsmD [Roseomonas sp. SSH11]|uniref:16S rRNA (Guanine(966)-N(2))-methyltransferase RsmD n=1 Tax=Pararoseomonas baculiformis TaxID=2820812 RepID=A0ABS4ABA1_9PROT|nr:16S rRNA (guanine(966)-N(2))-methyltransferase RsmD [Pararoseomonas baculiformis]MBP0444284.1 16S rRNA (guanine(966)-N(2))-methyltransferase RsmD [Pararoseomonas baculiformis]